MIAGDPQPVAAALERGERRTVRPARPVGGLDVMEIVAERNDGPRRYCAISRASCASVSAVS